MVIKNVPRWVHHRFLRWLVVPEGYVPLYLCNLGLTYFFNPSDSAQGLQLYLHGKYGAGSELLAQLAFYNVIRKGDVVVDVGAHYGFYTLLAAKKAGDEGTVLSFEPSKENFRVLKTNVAVNRLKNVRLFNFALGDREGMGVIGIPHGAHSGENTLAIELHQARRVEEIYIQRFDQIACKLGLNSVDVIKIDVEGAEMLVLEGFGDISIRLGI